LNKQVLRNKAAELIEKIEALKITPENSQTLSDYSVALDAVTATYVRVINIEGWEQFEEEKKKIEDMGIENVYHPTKTDPRDIN
jgi:hypothetical protein